MVPKLGERFFIIECIQLYRKLECLWNIKNEQYRDREKKRKAYLILLEKYREMYPEATVDDLKKKINSLRTNYRKELKKHITFLNTEEGATKPYEPSSWFYAEMVFLQGLEDISIDEKYSNEDCFVHLDDKEEGDKDKGETSLPFVDTVDSTQRKEVKHNHKSHSKKRKMDECLTYPQKLKYENNDDYYLCWAKACARDLQTMDSLQQIYAKKAISDILMEGQLGLLNRNSVQINNPLLQTPCVNPLPDPQYLEDSDSSESPDCQVKSQ